MNPFFPRNWLTNLRTVGTRRWLLFAVLTVCTALWIFGMAWWWWKRTRPPGLLTHAVTLAGVGPQLTAGSLSDPFGVAVNGDGAVFVSDGVGGRIFRLNEQGAPQLVTDQLDMPSALAVAPDGSLIIANTGAHTIVRVNPQDGAVTLVAGIPHQRGRADGAGLQAQFDAPIGVAVGQDGTIYVADSYNDRVCAIDARGVVTTLASDGFDTPCAVAVLPNDLLDGAVLVADTGHHRIRRIGRDGAVTTLAGTGIADVSDGDFATAAFDQPIALAVRRDGAVAVADAGSGTIRLLRFGAQPQVSTLAGGYPFGLRDGARDVARFGRPYGLAFSDDDALLIADGGNGFVRALLPAGVTRGRLAQPEEALLSPTQFRAALPSRWPFAPFDTPRDIAGTFGEVRGERAPDREAWFHNGLDIAGAYGETVYALFGERLTHPLAVEGVGETRERLRLPLFGYIHLRIGRDQNDQPFEEMEKAGMTLRRDAQGGVTGVRLRRGMRIQTGQAIGTLNRLNHVHLIAGLLGGEVNALTALSLPRVSDRVAPVIERVSFFPAAAVASVAALLDAKPAPKGKPAVAVVPVVSGRQRIVVQAYDQADGNARYRRLGLYRLGYQVFHASGQRLPDFAAPRLTLDFARLPADPHAASLAYAEGSQAGYSGRTVFAYLVTNVVRQGVAREEWWDTAALAAGDYLVLVIAEDFFGNRTWHKTLVKVVK